MLSHFLENASLERSRPLRLRIAAPRAAHSRPALGHLLAQWLRQHVVDAPLEPVLHASAARIRAVALLVFAGHSLAWLLRAVGAAQPQDDMHLLAACSGLALLVAPAARHPENRLCGALFVAMLWFALPFSFTWSYLASDQGAAALGSLVAMIFAGYMLTDWRIATILIATGALAARLFASGLAHAPVAAAQDAHAAFAVLASSVAAGIALGATAKNQRADRLEQRLLTVGIVAHDLRTPLATLALVGDAVRGSAGDCGPAAHAKLEQLAARMHMLVRNMNHQIDMQFGNARLASLPARVETLWAAEIVRSAVANYPFRTTREREAVRISVHEDFAFEGSNALFAQVLDNLIKNALRALAAAGLSLRTGDVSIDVGVRRGAGRIIVADRGIGIDPQVRPYVFDAFFTTHPSAGHGLGLAFCRTVVERAAGTIRVRSAPGQGSIFMIELPVSGRA